MLSRQQRVANAARGLAKLMKGAGVTVNSVLPGPTMSEGVEGFLRAVAQKSGKTIDETAAAS